MALKKKTAEAVAEVKEEVKVEAEVAVETAAEEVAEVEKLIREEDMKKITPNTLDTMVKLKEALADIRQKGFAYDLEEIELGLRCVAAPIRNHKGEIIAGISLSGPAGRMPDERMAELSKDVIAAGRRISAKLGYRG